jgi:hypothetical protein
MIINVITLCAAVASQVCGEFIAVYGNGAPL